VGATIAEKILARAGGRTSVDPGEIVEARVDVAMSHENAGLVIRNFREIGVPKVFDPDRIVILFDHRVPADSVKTATGQKDVREFVKEQGIRSFYDINVGICHQILGEKGHVRPGELLVGTDSHTTTHGAFGAFATGIGATEMAGVWSTGTLWLKVPETLRITLEGRFPRRVSAKDLILHVIGTLRADGADYRSVEFYGETVEEMTLASRMVLSNLSMEMGAKAALCPVDEKTEQYVRSRTDSSFEPVRADPDAAYERTFEFRVDDLAPQVACPHAVDNVRQVSDIAGTRIHQAFLGSCTNGRLEDLAAAAEILQGKRVHPDCRTLVIPASSEVYLDALRAGFIEIFVRAGALVLNPGCGPCLGAHQGLLAPGERCISSTNRNFKGRMGSPEAEVYLASPETVAASALSAEIADPRAF
jgi:3-isopropylmalate/(R)-2-methylmalate dehydratase large subunit